MPGTVECRLDAYQSGCVVDIGADGWTRWMSVQVLLTKERGKACNRFTTFTVSGEITDCTRRNWGMTSLTFRSFFPNRPMHSSKPTEGKSRCREIGGTY